MIEESWYQIRILGFLVQVSRKILPVIKEQMANAISKFAEGDTAFIHHPDKELLLLNPSEEIARLTNYKVPVEYKYRDFFDETILAMTDPLPFAQKQIFLFTDSYEKRRAREIRGSLNFEKNNKTNFRFLLCSFGGDSLEEICQYHPRCRHVQVKPEEVCDLILQEYAAMGELWKEQTKQQIVW